MEKTDNLKKFWERGIVLLIIFAVLLLNFGSCIAENGWPLIGGFQNVLVTDAQIIQSPGIAYLEVTIPRNILPFYLIHANVFKSKVEIKVDPSVPGTLVSTKDSFIWDNYMPEVNHLAIIVRTESLKQKWENKLNSARKKVREKTKPQDIIPW